jgi:hypothetical protein
MVGYRTNLVKINQTKPHSQTPMMLGNQAITSQAPEVIYHQTPYNGTISPSLRSRTEPRKTVKTPKALAAQVLSRGKQGMHLERRAHIFSVCGQLRVLGPAQRWQFPVVHIVPPPANPAAECMSAERGIAVPVAPAGEC